MTSAVNIIPATVSVIQNNRKRILQLELDLGEILDRLEDLENRE